MVIEKLKKIFTANDEKYEILYYRYSKLKLDNQNLKEKYEKLLNDTKLDLTKKFAKHLIDLFQDVEETKNISFKIEASNPDIQRLFMQINKVEKEMKKIMKDFYIEEIIPKERMYDPELHEVSSYSDSKGMKKGLILKTTKKGFKFRGDTIKKPKVVVTK